MELGEKIKFKEYLKKKPYVNSYYSKIDKDTGYLKYDTIELEEFKEGIFCGYRTIGYRGYTTQNDYGMDYNPLENKKIALIACDTRGFYRVDTEKIIMEWFDG